MLPKKNRLTTKEFSDVFPRGKVLSSPYFMLRFLKNGGSEYKKFSFVVSKKIAKKATQRNVLRRRGYRALSEIKNNIISNAAGIFFLKKEGVPLSSPDAKKEIKNLLQKAGLLSS